MGLERVATLRACSAGGRVHLLNELLDLERYFRCSIGCGLIGHLFLLNAGLDLAQIVLATVGLLLRFVSLCPQIPGSGFGLIRLAPRLLDPRTTQRRLNGRRRAIGCGDGDHGCIAGLSDPFMPSRSDGAR